MITSPPETNSVLPAVLRATSKTLFGRDTFSILPVSVLTLPLPVKEE
jgi:hypothetical protein